MASKNQRIDQLILFIQIHRLGSLAAAADALGISRSSVSKQLLALEKQLGSRLFNRTTRKIMLTEVGQKVLQEAHAVEAAIHRIEHVSEDSRSVIGGELTISCPAAQGRVHLVPLLAEFLKLYPSVKVNLQLEERIVDMVAENIDVSFRVGHLPDSSLIARKLGDLNLLLCASPEYIKSAPPLETPADLINHQCLFYRNSKASMNNWSFVSKYGEETVPVSGQISINDPGVLVSAALCHTGVLLMDKGLLGDALDTGKLVPVMPNYQPIGGLPIYVVYPEREFTPAKTRALVDFLFERTPLIFRK
ncbi:MAG: LysR family transcriptional regulator [Alteromonadales bacterium]|nr:LysR family transcriptional regulator [Alteromonadales bacterium]